ncbi:MAG: metal-sensing transcriptional repressor [Tissierellia bacterium]|nr:metal-sensing transcriptional repressor [Tissierellia bacterium]
MKADHKKILKRLKIISGQIDGIIKMVEEDRYCLDISNQIMAVNSALKSANNEILKSHIEHCVKDSLNGNFSEVDQKIQEISNIIQKMGK